MNNITENPHLVHSELNWRELKDILIELEYLNSDGFPKQKYRESEEMGFGGFGNRDILVSGEMLEWMFNSVNRHIKENGVPEKPKNLSFEDLNKRSKRKL